MFQTFSLGQEKKAKNKALEADKYYLFGKGFIKL